MFLYIFYIVLLLYGLLACKFEEHYLISSRQLLTSRPVRRKKNQPGHDYTSAALNENQTNKTSQKKTISPNHASMSEFPCITLSVIVYLFLY